MVTVKLQIGMRLGSPWSSGMTGPRAAHCCEHDGEICGLPGARSSSRGCLRHRWVEAGRGAPSQAHGGAQEESISGCLPPSWGRGDGVFPSLIGKSRRGRDSSCARLSLGSWGEMGLEGQMLDGGPRTSEESRAHECCYGAAGLGGRWYQPLSSL